jgi:hypothetical protein
MCAAQRAAPVLCYFFLVQERSNQESEPKAAPLETAPVPRCKAEQERLNIYCLCCAPRQTPRAAGVGSKGFYPEMNANFFNSHSQNLHLFTFAPQSGKIHFAVAHCGNPKGIRPFGAFSSPILCGKAKNGHKCDPRSAKLYARPKEKL